MARTQNHRPECVQQAECGNCGGDDIMEEERDFDPITPIPEESDDEMSGGVSRRLRCRNCGEEGTVKITERGLEVDGSIDYSNASWNQTDD